MSYHGHTVIDADCHIRQYWDLDRSYKEYMDPEYRDQYQRFSDAVRAVSRGPGDSGFRTLIWPSLPTHPLGVYDTWEGPPQKARSTNQYDGRQISGNGVEIDPACHWDPSIR